jgi:hypothetical protein
VHSSCNLTFNQETLTHQMFSESEQWLNIVVNLLATRSALVRFGRGFFPLQEGKIDKVSAMFVYVSIMNGMVGTGYMVDMVEKVDMKNMVDMVVIVFEMVDSLECHLVIL